MASEAHWEFAPEERVYAPVDNMGQERAKRAMEKRLLQLAILVGGFVPVLAGADGALRGTRFLGAWPGRAADSEFRYTSGLLLGIGLVLWGCIPTIERRTTIVRTLTLIVVVGGLCRLCGWIAVGDPGTIRWAFVMELLVTPLLCLWQTRIARKSSRD